MKSIETSLVTLSTVGLLFLGACSSGDQATKTETTTATSTPATVAKTEPQVIKEGEKHDESSNHKHSGGKYHIELKPDLDKDSIHLDTKLHGEQDKEITDAKLIAQVQLPDGSNKTLPVLYNTEEKQYTAKLPASATKGDYKVVLQVNVKGEKFNSRFSFKQ
jgi:hypothetical protein